jgi:hypothetical protein
MGMNVPLVNLPLPVLGELFHNFVKMIQGKDISGTRVEYKAELDTLYLKIYYQEIAKQNALSPVATLGSGEQRAGNINSYNWQDHLQDLWHPSPAVPASDLDQA